MDVSKDKQKSYLLLFLINMFGIQRQWCVCVIRLINWFFGSNFVAIVLMFSPTGHRFGFSYNS